MTFVTVDKSLHSWIINLIISFFGNFNRKEKQRVRTPEVNLLFELTKRTTDIYENKKSGILTHSEMDSALVGLSVLSSIFFRFVFANCSNKFS